MLGSLSHEDLDRLLDGGNRREELEEVAVLLGVLRDGLVEAPVEGVARRHLTAIALAAAEVSPSARRGGEELVRPARRRSTRRAGLRGRLPRLVATGVVAGVGLSILSFGLAFAGVELPVPAADALAKVGVILPENGTQTLPSVDQLPPDASDTAVAVIGAIESYLPQLQDGTISGCEFGAFVSAAATGEDVDASHCEGAGLIAGAGSVAGDHAQGHDSVEGGSQAGERASSAGRSIADDASGGRASEGHPGS